MMAEHIVLRTWVRGERGAVPEERDALDLVAGEGVAGDHTRGGRRHVTLLFEDDLNAALEALGVPVDPARRRANILLSGGGAGALIGATLRLGEATLLVRGETKPCHVMDAAAPGLRAALEPEARSGVWAEVVTSGRVTAGTAMTSARRRS